MDSFETLSDYFVFFNDKIFAEIAEIPQQIREKWQQFRYLLKRRPLDLERINVFVKQMYDIPAETLSFALQVPETAREKKKSAYLLKKKSTLSSNFNGFPEKYEKNCEKLAETRVTTVEIHEFLPVFRKKTQVFLTKLRNLKLFRPISLKIKDF